MDVQTGSRIIRCCVERCIEVRDPSSRVVIVSHQIDPIDVLSNPRPRDIGSSRLCGSSNRKKVRARLRHGPLVKLPPELSNQERVIRPILRSVFVLRTAARHRIFPIEVEAVKETWPAIQEELQCRGHEPPSRCRCQSDIGKLPRPIPSADCYEDFQVRMAFLELTQMREISSWG